MMILVGSHFVLFLSSRFLFNILNFSFKYLKNTIFVQHNTTKNKNLILFIYKNENIDFYKFIFNISFKLNFQIFQTHMNTFCLINVFIKINFIWKIKLFCINVKTEKMGILWCSISVFFRNYNTKTKNWDYSNI